MCTHVHTAVQREGGDGMGNTCRICGLLAAAAKTNGGPYVLRSDEIPLFQQILAEGGTHVLQNAQEGDDESFHNQAQLEGYHFSIYTEEKLACG